MFIGLVSFMLALLLATTAMTVSQCSSSPDDPPDSSQKISAPTETDTGTPAQPTMVLRTNRPDTREPIYVDPPEPVAAPPMPAPMAPRRHRWRLTEISVLTTSPSARMQHSNCRATPKVPQQDGGLITNLPNGTSNVHIDLRMDNMALNRKGN